jgi:PIN domain nuclease of toxin-antitoxin system
MQLLLDTQILIWLEAEKQKIPSEVLEKIYSSEDVYFSKVSVWEMAIKIKIKKLALQQPLFAYIHSLRNDYKFELLDISINHIYYTQQLELHHRDPFDRLLIAQSFEQNIPIISSDEIFDLI